MPGAATLGDATSHPGIVGDPCVDTVRINGRPAAVALAIHICALPPKAGPHPPNPFLDGSGTVFIGGRAALRWGDKAGCGAQIVSASRNVYIGG
jgi:uncharacterized Zn-binding protein involved in type VI secretion